MAAYTNEELYGPCPCGSGKKLKFCCKDGLVRRPDRADARELELAIDEANANNLAAARARLEKLVAAGSNEVLVHAVLASLLAADGDDDAAIARARATLAIVPGHVATNALLAQLLTVRGDRVEANAILDRVLRAPIKDGAEAHTLVTALGVLERDHDVVTVCGRLFGQMTHLLAFAWAVAAFNVGDKATATRVLVASLKDHFDDLGAVILQMAGGSGPVVPWPRLGTVHPAVWLPGERTLLALSELEASATASTDVPRSEVLAQALRQLTLTSLGTDEERAIGNVVAAMSRLAPSVAARELALVANSQLGTPAARALFAMALSGLSSTAAPVVDAAPVVVEAAPGVVEAAPIVVVEAAPVVVEDKPAEPTKAAKPKADKPASAPLSLFPQEAPVVKASTSPSTLPTPVAQMGLFGEVIAAPAAEAKAAEPKPKKAASTTLPTIDREAPTRAWYESHSLADLRRFLDAFGVEHDGVKKKSGLLELLTHAVEDEDLVVDIVNELREHEDLFDVSDALIDAGGFVALDEMTRRFGVPKEGDALSDLDMLLANGLAVQAIVDGTPSVALPTPIRRVLCEATREEA